MRSNDMILWLVLVKIGQELGADSPLARAVHDVLAALFAIGR